MVSREQSDFWVTQETLDRLRVQRDQARAQVDELENQLTEARHMYLRSMSKPLDQSPSQDADDVADPFWREKLMRPVVKAAVALAIEPSPETWNDLKQAVKEYDGRDT